MNHTILRSSAVVWNSGPPGEVIWWFLAPRRCLRRRGSTAQLFTESMKVFLTNSGFSSIFQELSKNISAEVWIWKIVRKFQGPLHSFVGVMNLTPITASLLSFQPTPLSIANLMYMYLCVLYTFRALTFIIWFVRNSISVISSIHPSTSPASSPVFRFFYAIANCA